MTHCLHSNTHSFLSHIAHNSMIGVLDLIKLNSEANQKLNIEVYEDSRQFAAVYTQHVDGTGVSERVNTRIANIK